MHAPATIGIRILTKGFIESLFLLFKEVVSDFDATLFSEKKIYFMRLYMILLFNIIKKIYAAMNFI